MSQENAEVARRWVELFNERDDVDEFLSLLDPEVMTRRGSGTKLPSRMSGHASSPTAS
jgi:hypothetical protein